VTVINKVRFVISQPPVRKDPSEWDTDLVGMSNFQENIGLLGKKALAAVSGEAEPELCAGDEQCRYCPAKLDCEAYARLVAEAVLDGFDDLTQTPAEALAATEGFETVKIDSSTDAGRLAGYFGKLALIRKWCDAVEAEATERGLRGEIGEAQGYKMVEGRKGNAEWSDEAEAEETLKAMRFKKEEMYAYKLISPTKARELLAEAPRKLAKIEKLITNKDGKPVLVPLSDNRPALTLAASDEGFDDLVGEPQTAGVDDLIGGVDDLIGGVDDLIGGSAAEDPTPGATPETSDDLVDDLI
jgi:hypothetical protein